MLPVIKIAILSHDIGKGYATDASSMWYGKHKQANQMVAHDLYKELEIDAKYIKLLDFIFTEGQDFTSQYYFGKGDNAQNKEEIDVKMKEVCENILRQTFKSDVTDYEICSLQKLCITLQQCDSGAYTRFATINGGQNGFYLGGSDRFTKSFTIGKDGNPRLKTYQDEQIFVKYLTLCSFLQNNYTIFYCKSQEIVV